MAGTGTLAVTPGTGASVNTLPPSGAATPVNSLPVVLDTSVETAPGTPGTLAISVQGNASGVALPISSAALTTIATNTPALGQKVSTASAPVVIASDQTTLATAAVVASTSTATSVASAATATMVLAANSARRRYSIYNDSSAVLYGLENSGTVSTTNYSYQLPPGGYYSTNEWSGAVNAIWATANGSARVTEYAA